MLPAARRGAARKGVHLGAQGLSDPARKGREALHGGPAAQGRRRVEAERKLGGWLRAGARAARAGTRRLLLLRHAKAERGSRREGDHDRALTPRGRRDAERIGAAIEDRRLAPEHVLCSSARRTRETFDRIRPHLPEGLDVVVDRELYLASPERLLERIGGVDERVRTLLVVGHNPGMAALAELLVGRGDGDADALARMRHKFPTCGLAEIESDAVHWRELALAGGSLVAFLTPRALRIGGG
jgi:phosphohistidine phosphatase